MLVLEKKFNEYLAQNYEPVDESAMPFLVDIRALKMYADTKGVTIPELSEEEKKQFLIPNSQYKKKRKSSIAAAIL